MYKNVSIVLFLLAGCSKAPIYTNQNPMPVVIQTPSVDPERLQAAKELWEAEQAARQTHQELQRQRIRSHHYSY
jgi:hypothetical protein